MAAAIRSAIATDIPAAADEDNPVTAPIINQYMIMICAYAVISVLYHASIHPTTENLKSN